MNKKWLFGFVLFCRMALGQYAPPIALVAQTINGQMVYVSLDGNGYMYTNGGGSGTTATPIAGYIPPAAMTALTPQGTQVYLRSDANGNLFVNCQSGCGGGSGNLNVYTITASASPTITSANGLFTITLGQNTTPSISGIQQGQRLTFQICQPVSGGPYTWTWPASIHGGAAVTVGAGLCTMQSFDSWSGNTLVAENAGASGVAP